MDPGGTKNPNIWVKFINFLFGVYTSTSFWSIWWVTMVLTWILLLLYPPVSITWTYACGAKHPHLGEILHFQYTRVCLRQGDSWIWFCGSMLGSRGIHPSWSMPDHEPCLVLFGLRMRSWIGLNRSKGLKYRPNWSKIKLKFIIQSHIGIAIGISPVTYRTPLFYIYIYFFLGHELEGRGVGMVK